MREQISTPEQVANYFGRKPWHVAGNGTLFVSISDPDSASREVTGFLRIVDLFTSQSVRDDYSQQLTKYKKEGKVPYDWRLDILTGVLDKVLIEATLGDNKKDPRRFDQFLAQKRNLDTVLINLRKQALHDQNSEDPFIVDLTRGKKMRIEDKGKVEEVEVKSVCPAPEFAKKLYWDLSRILEDPSSEKEELEDINK